MLIFCREYNGKNAPITKKIDILPRKNPSDEVVFYGFLVLSSSAFKIRLSILIPVYSRFLLYISIQQWFYLFSRLM